MKGCLNHCLHCIQNTVNLFWGENCARYENTLLITPTFQLGQTGLRPVHCANRPMKLLYLYVKIMPITFIITQRNLKRRNSYEF